MAVKIKICGITNEEDATWAVNMGASYIGLNFYSQSPRKVSPDQAAKVVKKVPPFVPCVGVFVDHPVQDILKVVAKTGVMGIQLHGDYSPEDCQALRSSFDGSVLLIKAFRVATDADLDPLVRYRDAATHFLLDAKVEEPVPAAPAEGAAPAAPSDNPARPLAAAAAQLGGTGKTYPWGLTERAKAQGVPVFVAGGLTPENVREAVKQTQPFAVDVASGVEKSPKRKDYDKMKAFIEQAKRG
jgi:phosphoribosylanthranilate isomerase